VHVGEWYGCTGDYALYDHLEAKWGVAEEHSIPVWEGIHDYLTVLLRKVP